VALDAQQNIPNSEKENLFIFGIYRQPDDSVRNHVSGATELIPALQEIGDVIDALDGHPDITFGGNFNITYANWRTKDTTSAATNELHNSMSAFQNNYFFSQMINVPTHKAGTILDLLFTNNRQMINEVHAMLSNFADHYIVEIATHFKSNSRAGH
jgi:hypothetical protein